MMAEASDFRALTGSTAWRPLFAALLATGLAGVRTDTHGVGLGGLRRRAVAMTAPEEKDRGALMDMVSPTYSDARGNSRDDIENLFRFYFLRARKVGLLVSIDDIEVYDDTAAQVMLTVAMGATTDSVLGFNADAYEFELDLEKTGDEWLLVSGRWNDVGRELH